MTPATTTEKLKDQPVLVAGLGSSGQAACRLLRRRGARVTAVDEADSASLRQQAQVLQADGVRVQLGVQGPPEEPFSLAVVSPGVPCQGPLIRPLAERGVPLVGELELGYQHSHCPNIAITGTNGKTTTTELVARVLTQTQRKTVAAGNIGLPLCAVAEQSRGLDWLTLEVSSFQLETVQYFRPAVAVLLNLTPDHLDRYAAMADYIRAKARIFQNQQPLDWAIVQLEALRLLASLNLAPPSQIITFSAHAPGADFHLSQGRIASRGTSATGDLLDPAQGRLRGPHNAENLMAALAVAVVLRLPLDQAVAALNTYEPAPHRCEVVAEIGEVQFVNDSKATNVDAVRQALLTVRPAVPPAPNVWLIAGGKDKGFDYEELGPLLAQRVKGAFLLGETRARIRAAWDRFTPCKEVQSLVEAVTEAAQSAVGGDVILLSPACSSFDMFQNYQHRGETFRQAVQQWARQRGQARRPPVNVR